MVRHRRHSRLSVCASFSQRTTKTTEDTEKRMMHLSLKVRPEHPRDAQTATTQALRPRNDEGSLTHKETRDLPSTAAAAATGVSARKPSPFIQFLGGRKALDDLLSTDTSNNPLQGRAGAQGVDNKDGDEGALNDEDDMRLLALARLMVRETALMEQEERDATTETELSMHRINQLYDDTKRMHQQWNRLLEASNARIKARSDALRRPI